MKKRSIFFLATIVMILVIPFGYYKSYLNSKDYFQQDVEFRKRVLVSYLDLAKMMIESKQEDRLVRILDEGIKVHMFDWYLITAHGEPVLFNPPGMEAIKIPEIDGQVNDDENKSSGTIKLQNSSYLTIGINKRWTKYIEKIESRYWATTIEDNAISIIIVLAIFAFLLKDILRVVKSLKAGKGLGSLKELKNRNNLNAETAVFSEIMQGYQQSVDQLTSERTQLVGQVLPSLRSELASGRKPPYEFDCVMVRTDINRYSQMFSLGHREVLMKVIHLFFSEASLIVSRYGGYMHEFVGDELIFYFKTEEQSNAVAMALSCLTEIQAATKTYQDQIRQVYQLPFTVKSSVSMGRLYFGPLVNGFSLVGPPLIESVRVLSLIEERDQNVAFVPEEVKLQADKVFEFAERGSFLLKGFEKKHHIFELTGRLDLAQVLEIANDQSLGTLACYRRPQEILQVLNYLLQTDKFTQVQILKILGFFREPYVGGNYPEIRDALIALVRKHRMHKDSEAVTATAIRLTMNLLAPTAYNQELRDFFIDSLDIESDRGIANTIEAFGYFENLNAQSLYERFKMNGSNRTIGNILVLWGKSGITDDLCKAFTECLRTKRGPLKISCAYAHGAITSYWQQKDIVYLRAQIEFTELGQKFSAKTA